MDKTKWSRYFDNCVICGKTDFKHVAKGCCNSCYLKVYRNDPNHSERIKKQKTEWYKKQPKEKGKMQREMLHFDSMRDAALKRDEHTCQNCGTKNYLVVHHLDEQGRNKEIKNNSLNNLQTLCKSCHVNVHRELLNAKRKEKSGKTWHKSYFCCKGCKRRKSRKHYGHGYCEQCYYKYITLKKKPLKGKFVWSLNYPQCTNCGTTETKHEGFGLCRKCFYIIKVKGN